MKKAKIVIHDEDLAKGRRGIEKGCKKGQENSSGDEYSVYHLREWARDPEKDKGENEEFEI